MHEKRPGEHAAGHGKQRAQSHEKEQRRGHGAAQLVLPPRAVKLGDHDARAVAEADGKGEEHQRERAGRAGGGQRLLRHEVADDDAVDGVVKLLKQVAGHDGQRKQKDMLPFRPRGHIVFSDVSGQDSFSRAVVIHKNVSLCTVSFNIT